MFMAVANYKEENARKKKLNLPTILLKVSKYQVLFL